MATKYTLRETPDIYAFKVVSTGPTTLNRLEAFLDECCEIFPGMHYHGASAESSDMVRVSVNGEDLYVVKGEYLVAAHGRIDVFPMDLFKAFFKRKRKEGE